MSTLTPVGNIAVPASVKATLTAQGDNRVGVKFTQFGLGVPGALQVGVTGRVRRARKKGGEIPLGLPHSELSNKIQWHKCFNQKNRRNWGSLTPRNPE